MVKRLTLIKAGVDFSYTSPAVTIDNNGELTFIAFKQKKKQVSLAPNLLLLNYPEWSTDQERYHKITEIIYTHIRDVDVINIEGYSYGSAAGAVFNIAEATGTLKHKLFMAGKSWNVVAPSELKKFATGKGNSKKRAMVNAAKEKGINLYPYFDIEDDGGEKIVKPIDDIIDSYWLSQFNSQRG